MHVWRAMPVLYRVLEVPNVNRAKLVRLVMCKEKFANLVLRVNIVQTNKTMALPQRMQLRVSFVQMVGHRQKKVLPAMLSHRDRTL